MKCCIDYCYRPSRYIYESYVYCKSHISKELRTKNIYPDKIKLNEDIEKYLVKIKINCTKDGCKYNSKYFMGINYYCGIHIKKLITDKKNIDDYKIKDLFKTYLDINKIKYFRKNNKK